MRIKSDQNDYDFSKQLGPVTMLKKKRYLRFFLSSFVKTMAFETFCELFYKFLDDCS